jgi:hypothetical protein
MMSGLAAAPIFTLGAVEGADVMRDRAGPWGAGWKLSAIQQPEATPA